jgi:hypothetical protein
MLDQSWAIPNIGLESLDLFLDHTDRVESLDSMVESDLGNYYDWTDEYG